MQALFTQLAALQKLGGILATLSLMDFVTDDLAAVQVLDHVQVVELPTDSRGAIGDIPAPYFARAAGSMGRWHRTATELTHPDIQVHFITFSTTRMGDQLHSYPAFTASVCQLRPESRGYVRITSADPAVAPSIDPNYLAAEVDRQANVEGLKVLRKILRAPAMQPFVETEIEPGSGCVSDEVLLQYCQQHGASIYHPTCTARMGSDRMAVVDECLRVRGVKGLRVADGSIMPSLISGNSNAAIIMIGEKAADMILAEAGACT